MIKPRVTARLLKPFLTALSRRALPTVSGDIRLAGLNQPVTIHRDRWGIPHILANSRDDLFFSQGYVHAQDRLWQMEIFRRAASGRLAEILGVEALQTDRLTRTLGFTRLAQLSLETTSDQVRKDAEAYSAGVNALLDSNPTLPIEFRLTRHKPEPWKSLDSFSVGRLMAWPLSHIWSGKLIRAKLIEAVGPQLASELEPPYPERNPLTLPKGIEYNALVVDEMFQANGGRFLGQSFKGGSQGSNSWVIAGSRTSSGLPILCNDMHMPINAPSIWYFNHLYCPSATLDSRDLHVSGVSLAGLPYVLVGHNDHIAWGATVSFLDNEDLYIEQIDDANNKYFSEGEWLPLEITSESIAVRGRSNHTEIIRKTHHGPIISGLISPGENILALQSMALKANEGFDGFVRLSEARNWDDFVNAVQEIAFPPLNLTYADKEGNIGYYVTGRVPLRANGKGQVPVPGWDGEYEWLGSVPVEEMPHALNPDQGFIVSANNKIVGDDYPHYLGISWRNGYRARRVSELIQASSSITIEDCRRHQNDIMSIPGHELIEVLKGVTVQDLDALISLDILLAWNGQLDQGSCGGTVYKVFLDTLARAILLPRLGDDLLSEYLGIGVDPVLYPASEFHGLWPIIALNLLANPESPWWDSTFGHMETINRCLAETTIYLRKELGNDSDNWHWGHLHHIKFDHIMAAQSLLEPVFCLGPYPIGGDQDTVAQASVVGSNPGDNIAASFRQIIDMSALDKAIGMHVPGQSGNLASRHYSDLVRPWLEGTYYPMTWTVDETIASSDYQLSLLPDESC